MVKVAAPCLSLDASGSIAGAITYTKWKGRPVVRQLVKPANPQSAMQTGVRAMFKFLSQQWATLLDVDRASWLERATAGVYANFNGYMSYNMLRWRNGLGPTHQDPVGLTGDFGNINWTSADGGVRMATLVFDRIAPQRHWGCLIARSVTDGFTPGLDSTKMIVSLRTGAAHAIVDTPLAAGTYYYRCRYFNFDGFLADAWIAQETAVVADV